MAEISSDSDMCSSSEGEVEIGEVFDLQIDLSEEEINGLRTAFVKYADPKT